jgi:hypothetical protein
VLCAFSMTVGFMMSSVIPQSRVMNVVSVPAANMSCSGSNGTISVTVHINDKSNKKKLREN